MCFKVCGSGPDGDHRLSGHKWLCTREVQIYFFNGCNRISIDGSPDGSYLLFRLITGDGYSQSYNRIGSQALDNRKRR